MNISTLITGHETVGDHTEFVIQVSWGGIVWLVSRRFSDFDQLHLRLKQRENRYPARELPPKQWFGRFDASFLSNRQDDLQLYLDALVQLPYIHESKILQQFLEIENNVELSADYQATSNSVSLDEDIGDPQSKQTAINMLELVKKAEESFVDISNQTNLLNVNEQFESKEQISRKQSEILNQVEHFHPQDLHPHNRHGNLHLEQQLEQNPVKWEYGCELVESAAKLIQQQLELDSNPAQSYSLSQDLIAHLSSSTSPSAFPAPVSLSSSTDQLQQE